MFIKWRDPAVADISDEALRRLTKLLYMDAAEYFDDRAREWLAEQEQQVKGLDATLLHTKNLFTRLVISMGRQRFPFCSEEPTLCSAHKALDPRVIRNVLQLVADECTIQTNRYRSLRLKKRLSPSLEDWLGRMDSLTALWLGEDKFRHVFGCSLRGKMPDCVRTKCEACILAVIGGSAIYLTDLRASVLARHAYNTKLTGRECRRPRLLRVINSWMSFFQEDCRKAICECSEAIMSDLVEIRTLARERRNKEDERRRKKGKPPRLRRNARVRLTKEGLPIPRQPKFRKGDEERLARRIEKRNKKPSSLQETVLERQARQQKLETFRRPVSDEAHDPTRASSASFFAQENYDTKTTTDISFQRSKESDSWEDCPLDDTFKKEAGEEEPSILLDDAPCKNIDTQSKLSFSTSTHHPFDDTISSWTSKVDGDSSLELPRIVQAPSISLDGEHLSLGTASSVYSCDERVNIKTKTKTFEEALSVISGFTRDSTALMSLGWSNTDLDTSKECERDAKHRTALEREEEEEDAASCYGTMGWGAPRRR